MLLEKGSMKVLITGAAGFIGSHLVEHLVANTDWDLHIIDRLNYASSLDRIAHLHNRMNFHYHDLRSPLPDQLLHALKGTDYIIHSAAETHVENSLHNPGVFVESNVGGTFNMLEAARKLQPSKFVMVSTDEVFGPAPVEVDYKENDRFAPSNPYSATKAASECLAMAWANCFQLPMIITRTMNNFGERQHPEKFVPLVIQRVLNGDIVPIHSDGTNPGSRKWLHARNHADAILFLLQHNAAGAFHIAGEERNNLELAQMIAGILGKPLRHKLIDYHSSRPGHDMRYSLDGSKIAALGWKPPVPFASSLAKTVAWTTEHVEWLWSAGELINV